MDRTALSHAAMPALAFGELLRRHRLAAQLTQESLAERAGLSMHGIQKLEGGASHPQRDTVQRLIAALQLVGVEEAHFTTAARPAPRSHQPHRSIPPPTVEPTRHNLPIATTSFVARAGEIQRVTQSLR